MACEVILESVPDAASFLQENNIESEAIIFQCHYNNFRIVCCLCSYMLLRCLSLVLDYRYVEIYTFVVV